MKIEKAGDLIFWTYYMLDWKTVEQTPSGQKCVQCGGEMLRVGPMEDSKGKKYDGMVCHSCKLVLWVKRV